MIGIAQNDNTYCSKEQGGIALLYKGGIAQKSKDNNTSINNININKERKKEAKTYDEILSNFSLSDRLTKTIMEFIKMRKMIKKPLTNKGLELMVEKLKKMAMNEDEQVKILEQSIMNNWLGLYELEEKNKPMSQEEVYRRFLEEGDE